jgi:Ala-tRNA(Pro) deacylase
MNVAPRVQDYLAARQTAYDVLSHARTGSSAQTARAAHVPADGLVKGVVVKDDAGYVLAVLPASRHVVLSQLARALHRLPLQLADEAEFTALFSDCDRGALPPLGGIYGLPMMVDEAVDEQPEVYFEAGDHEHLVHMTQAEFYRLTSGAPRARFSRPD